MPNNQTITTESKESVPNDRVTPAALRMRDTRQRRREGLRCITFEMRDTEIDRLIQLGLLDVADRDDHPRIVQALYAFLDRSALRGARRWS